MAALTYGLLFVGRFSSSAILNSPEDATFTVIGGLFTIILLGIAVRYGYYYYCWYTSRRSFGPARWVDAEALSRREIPHLTFQVTTKGGALPVVERSLRVLETTCARHPWLNANVSVEVITEVQEEADHLEAAFAESILDVTGVWLRPEYVTPNGSRLKARALHHMVELRRAGFNARGRRTFIVHFDEETVLTEPHLLVLVDYLTRDPSAISQGPIVYPLEWANAPWLCRAIESTRPFGCSECARVMQKPPPPHLHGSNLVVDEAVENRIGWDFGTLEGEAFVAEDLLFGLRAFAMLGKDAFGWHGATAMEQPPLSLHWAVQQRMRWVLGALQGMRAMWTSPVYDAMARADKRRLSFEVYSRIATYSLGFPVGLVGLVFIFNPLANAPGPSSPLFAVRAVLLLSALAWLVSYQIGLHRNLRYQSIPPREQAAHHLVMLVMTPVVGLCETVGPFISLIRWLVGSRAAQWTPTPKIADLPPVEGEEAAPEVPKPFAAPIPAWLFALPQKPGPAARARAARGPRLPAPRGPLVGVARALMVAGFVVALFVGYERLATGLFYDRSQQALLATFKQQLPTGAQSRPASLAEGDGVALLDIPRIGLSTMVVNGTTPDDLKQGPGLFRNGATPGEFGNAVIVGRRTTYGGPFGDVDHLANGDHITVTTGQGVFEYTVSNVHRSDAGSPDALNGTLDSRLTLLTSDPAYVPDGRLVVVAQLQTKPVDIPNRTTVPVSNAEFGLTGDSVGLGVALFWAVALGGVAWAAWRFTARWPARVRYLLLAPVTLTLVVLLFGGLDTALPGTL